MSCFLRCLERRHPDIVLPDGVKIIIGRSPETKIKEKQCSRKQLVLQAHYKHFEVMCKRLGGNPSFCDGNVIPMDKFISLGYGSTFEVLENNFKYKVIFNPPPPQGWVKDEGRLGSSSPPAKRSKTEGTAPLLAENPFFSLEMGKSIKKTESGEWRSLYDGKLLVYSPSKLTESDMLAAFDIDGTIITTVSGKVFPRDENDWKIMLPDIPGKLKELVAKGYRIVFITNQAGIERGKLKPESFMVKAERIVKRLGVPVQVICSTKEGGLFRKPRPGIWWWLVSQATNNKNPFNMDKSFYCGDAAGREVNWTGSRKKDFSCSDRLFALNAGLKFYTPEEYFQKQSPTTKYCLPDFDPKTMNKKPLLEPESAEFTKSGKDMILMVGIQGSGKSVIAELLEKKGYFVASNDRSGSKEKSLRLAREAIREGRRVVVDNTHRDRDARREYINIGKSSGIPVRCFLMTTNHNHARHNNIYRELTNTSHTKIKEMLFNQYRSGFQAPEMDEGFAEIVNVNFVSEFPDEFHEELYSFFLLEK